MAFSKPHHRLLPIRPLAGTAAETLSLALHHNGVHGKHLDPEQRFDRRLDFRLGRITSHLEGDLATFAIEGRLLGHQRGQDGLIHPFLADHRLFRLCGGIAHANRSFRASTPARVTASTSWLRMS